MQERAPKNFSAGGVPQTNRRGPSSPGRAHERPGKAGKTVLPLVRAGRMGRPGRT